MLARRLGGPHRIQQLGNLPAADDRQVLNVLEIGRHCLGDARANPVVGGITRHVGEREDGDAPLTRLDLRCPQPLVDSLTSSRRATWRRSMWSSRADW